MWNCLPVDLVSLVFSMFLSAYPTTEHWNLSLNRNPTRVDHFERWTNRSPFRLSMSYVSISSLPIDSPRSLIQKGMQEFRSGNVSSSLSYFNRAEAASKNDPALSLTSSSVSPYLWQRGITYYYLNMFQEGSDQFRLDVAVNPLDVEEIVWDIACLMRLHPNSFPPPSRLALPRGKKDRRRIMSIIYSLFRGDGATEADLAIAGHSGNIMEEFYSLFYLGLYCEIRQEESKAAAYMTAAKSTRYAMGPGEGDYMTSCARVHCSVRGWS